MSCRRTARVYLRCRYRQADLRGRARGHGVVSIFDAQLDEIDRRGNADIGTRSCIRYFLGLTRDIMIAALRPRRHHARRVFFRAPLSATGHPCSTPFEKSPPRAGGESLAHRKSDRAAVRGQRALDAARLCGARTRRIRQQRDRLSRREAGRRECRRLRLPGGGGRRDARPPSAARPDRAAEPARGRRALHRGDRHASDDRRQRLCRGGERRRRTARAACAAPGSHEAYSRRRRLAGGLRIHRRGPQRALRSVGRIAADLAPFTAASARRSLRPRAARSSQRRGRHAQCGGEMEQGAARQCGAALRRAGACRPTTRCWPTISSSG